VHLLGIRDWVQASAADGDPTPTQVLYVNMVTALTMGMMLAMEPAEDDIMARTPRRVGKRLLGKLVLWRCFFVSLLDILVRGVYGLGSYA
jgi:magnesium-transporting ATPase (P-type)